MKHRPVIVAIALALAAAPPLSVATAQPKTSDLPLFLEVRAGGVPMVLKVVDGATGTIESAAGVKVGLIPKVTSRGVEIHAFEIFSAPGFGEKAREVRSIEVGVGDTTRLTQTRLDLEVTLIRSAVPPVPPEWRTQVAVRPRRSYVGWRGNAIRRRYRRGGTGVELRGPGGNAGAMLRGVASPAMV